VAVPPLARIGDLSRESVDSMSEIVWAIDPAKDRLASLAARLRDLANEQLGARDIAFTFQVDGDLHDAIEPELRRQVFLVLKEGLHNAVRHAACGNVAIAIAIDEDTLTVRLEDDGRGFDKASVTRGRGLKSMFVRAASVGGSLDVATRPCGGTRLVLTVPRKGAPLPGGRRGRGRAWWRFPTRMGG
jgi:signal transduction histidine kinase